MDSKVFGIPLAVWVFIIGLGLVLGLPLWLTYKNEMVMLRRIDTDVMRVNRVVVVTPTPEATPSATPTVVLPLRSTVPVVKPSTTVK